MIESFLTFCPSKFYLFSKLVFFSENLEHHRNRTILSKYFTKYILRLIERCFWNLCFVQPLATTNNLLSISTQFTRDELDIYSIISAISLSSAIIIWIDNKNYKKFSKYFFFSNNKQIGIDGPTKINEEKQISIILHHCSLQLHDCTRYSIRLMGKKPTKQSLSR